MTGQSGSHPEGLAYRSPTPPPFSGTNSTPPLTMASMTAFSLRDWSRFVLPDSNARIVSCGTPDCSDKAADVHFRSALAALLNSALNRIWVIYYTLCVDLPCADDYTTRVAQHIGASNQNEQQDAMKPRTTFNSSAYACRLGRAA